MISSSLNDMSIAGRDCCLELAGKVQRSARPRAEQSAYGYRIMCPAGSAIVVVFLWKLRSPQLTTPRLVDLALNFAVRAHDEW